MKKTLYTFCLLLLPMLFPACGDDAPAPPSALQSADALLEAGHTGSATELLQSLENDMRQAPEDTRMYYHLLTIKATDHTHPSHASDSLIQAVVEYYQKAGDKPRLAEATYYRGKIYRDSGNPARALGDFQQAAELSDTTQLRLRELIYGQTGNLFLHQDLYGQALHMHRRACHYARLAQDSTGLVLGLRDIGRAFTTLEQPDSALHYYKEAAGLARSLKNQQLESTVNSELGGYYTELGNYDEARRCLQTALRQPGKGDTPATLSVLAGYYAQTGRLDSAELCYRRLLAAPGLLHRQTACQGLGNIARRKGDLPAALAYFDRYLACTDSLDKLEQTETARHINALYDQQQYKAENQKLKDENRKQDKRIVIMSFYILVMTIVFFANYQYLQAKERKRQLQSLKLKQAQEEQERQSQEQLERNKQKIEELELALQEAAKANDQAAQTLLQSRKEWMEKSNAQIEAQRQWQEQAVAGLKRSPAYRNFHDLARGEGPTPTDADWQALTEAVDAAYDGFTTRLDQLYPLSTVEVRVCLLLKIDLGPAQISTLTARTKQAVHSLRKRLYKKIFGKEGRAEDLDEFIRKF